MKSLHPVWTELIGFELTVLDQPRAASLRPRWNVRMRARVLARRLDRQVDEGVPPVTGSLLAAHYHRLGEAGERADLARGLQLVLRDAAEGPVALNPRVPVRTPEVLRFADVIEEVRTRLSSGRPVRARGMARLRILLTDARGPLYRKGSGSLHAALRGVLATL